MLKSYNPQELTAFAQRLLNQATAIMVVWTVLGTLIAFIGWKVATEISSQSLVVPIEPSSALVGRTARDAARETHIVISRDQGDPTYRFAVCGLVVLGFFFYGRERGLLLRVRAQELLCQVSIEQHARETAVSMARLASTVPEPRPRA